jgi:argininosuccinate synthase
MALVTSKQKVLLAYSGGLDTSCILAWLLDEVFYTQIHWIGKTEIIELYVKKGI